MATVNRLEASTIVDSMAGTCGSAAATINITVRSAVFSAEHVEVPICLDPARQQRRPIGQHRRETSWLFELPQPRASVRSDFHER